MCKLRHCRKPFGEREVGKSVSSVVSDLCCPCPSLLLYIRCEHESLPTNLAVASSFHKSTHCKSDSRLHPKGPASSEVFFFSCRQCCSQSKEPQSVTCAGTIWLGHLDLITNWIFWKSLPPYWCQSAAFRGQPYQPNTPQAFCFCVGRHMHFTPSSPLFFFFFLKAWRDENKWKAKWCDTCKLTASAGGAPLLPLSQECMSVLREVKMGS